MVQIFFFHVFFIRVTKLLFESDAFTHLAKISRKISKTTVTSVIIEFRGVASIVTVVSISDIVVCTTNRCGLYVLSCGLYWILAFAIVAIIIPTVVWTCLATVPSIVVVLRRIASIITNIVIVVIILAVWRLGC